MTIEIKDITDAGETDLSSINDDIKELAAKYIAPIDLIRSMATSPLVYNQGVKKEGLGNADAVIKKIFSNLEINANRSMESRASAFYRSIGLPIYKDGNYYNPGFEPNKINRLIERENIHDAILADQALTKILDKRERWPHERRIIFANQDDPAILYNLLLIITKDFCVMDLDKDIDDQKFTIQYRKQLAETAKKYLDVAGVYDFNTGQHILRPFFPHPRITETIVPQENNICVPFLPNKNSTMISQNISPLKRPYIEYVCRLRLKPNELNTAFINEVSVLVNSKNIEEALTSTGTSATAILDTIDALSNNLSDVGNIINVVKGFTNIQSSTILTYIKTIRAAIEKLNEIIVETELALQSDILFPVASAEGPERPERGAFIKTIFSNADATISRLKLEEELDHYNSKIEADILGVSSEDLGSLFVGPPISSAKKNYSATIKDIERTRDNTGNLILEHLADIERITGEISGLGLIDILSVYTALWAINIDELIALLDDNAFNRMWDNNPSFRSVPEVQNRKNGGGTDIKTAITAFEKKVFSILSFADKLKVNTTKNPRDLKWEDPSQG